MGERGQISAQFGFHAVGQAGQSERGRVGDFPRRGEHTEKYGVKTPVRENQRVPNLVAPGDEQVIGRIRFPQVVETLVTPLPDAENTLFKVVETVIAALHGGIMQGGMNVGQRA